MNYEQYKKKNRLPYLIAEIERNIGDQEIGGIDYNSSDWEHREGVLLTINQAKLIIETLKNCKHERTDTAT